MLVVICISISVSQLNGFVMKKKRGPLKKYDVIQDGPDMIFHKWKYNLNIFWLLHQKVLDEIEQNTLQFNTADKFYDIWVAAVAIYSYSSVQWTLPAAWREPEHKQMQLDMQEQMSQVRLAVKEVKEPIDEVISYERNRTRRKTSITRK